MVKAHKGRVYVVALLSWLLLMLLSPKIPLTAEPSAFADKRNFLGVPNTFNVISNFPFLIVGVVGFVLCVGGGFFNISSRGEIWGWALFYAGITGFAFGSAYYHIKPSGDRIIWDTLPILIAYPSLLSGFVAERVGERAGLSCLVSLLLAAVISVMYARACGDLRLCKTFQVIPCVAIPIIAVVLPPKYSHSRYWLWAMGAYVLAKLEELGDHKIYSKNHYIISGHTLGHLCYAAVPALLTLMLLQRSTRFHRLADCKGRP